MSEKIQSQYLDALQALINVTVQQCYADGLSKVETVKLVFMNTLVVLVGNAGQAGVPEDLFMAMVEQAFQTLSDLKQGFAAPH